jgi:hypothetical protein
MVIFVLLLFLIPDTFTLERDVVMICNAVSIAHTLVMTILIHAEVVSADTLIQEITAVILVANISVITKKIIAARTKFARSISRRVDHATTKMYLDTDVEGEGPACPILQMVMLEPARTLIPRASQNSAEALLIVMRAYSATRPPYQRTIMEHAGNQPQQQLETYHV